MTTIDISGKYYCTLSDADIPAEFPEEERGLMQGRWEHTWPHECGSSALLVQLINFGGTLAKFDLNTPCKFKN